MNLASLGEKEVGSVTYCFLSEVDLSSYCRCLVESAEMQELSRT